MLKAPVLINIITTCLFNYTNIGIILYSGFLIKTRRLELPNYLEIILICYLIYQTNLIIDNVITSSNYIGLNISFDPKMNNETAMSLANNNNNNINNTNDNFNNIPLNNTNNTAPMIIRYIATYGAAFMVRRPMTRVITMCLTTATNQMIDVMSNEQRLNFWLDLSAHYNLTGRVRGGRPGSGPFERGPWENGPINLNLVGDDESSKLWDYFFSPVEQTMSFERLLDIHYVLIFGLFIITVITIIAVFYCLVNLFIISNKDRLLKIFKNKYFLMYVKYVLFKSKFDFVSLVLLILASLLFMSYTLHYLIRHPIL